MGPRADRGLAAQVLTAAAADVSVAEVLDAYVWIWDGRDMAIAPGAYYAVAEEANGDLTMAHREDGRLVLFAPDHAFDGVTPLGDSPPYSLLTIDGVPDLAAWIEVCAAAWRHGRDLPS